MLISINKPTVIAANKLDKSAPGSLEELRRKLKGYEVIGCSGAGYESRSGRPRRAER